MEYTESIRYVLQDLGLRHYGKSGLNKLETMERIREKGVAASSPKHNGWRSLLHAVEKVLLRRVNTIAERCGEGCNLLLVANKS